MPRGAARGLGESTVSEVDLSVVIPSWNTRELTRECLRSLRADRNGLRREVLVVDNGSGDGSARMVAREFPEVVLLRNRENRLYAHANNQGARRARGEFLCLLNSDTRVQRGALRRLVAFLEAHPEYGAASPMLLDFDGSVQLACRRFPGLVLPLVESTSLRLLPAGRRLLERAAMTDFDHRSSRDVEQPPAACMVMRRREYLAMGGLDPRLGLYFNDVDLCRRLWRAGRRIRYVADAVVFHQRGGSTRALDAAARTELHFCNRDAYFRKHHGGAGRWMSRTALVAHAAEQTARIVLGPQSRAQTRQSLRRLGHLTRRCLRPAPEWHAGVAPALARD